MTEQDQYAVKIPHATALWTSFDFQEDEVYRRLKHDIIEMIIHECKYVSSFQKFIECTSREMASNHKKTLSRESCNAMAYQITILFKNKGYRVNRMLITQITPNKNEYNVEFELSWYHYDSDKYNY